MATAHESPEMLTGLPGIVSDLADVVAQLQSAIGLPNLTTDAQMVHTILEQAQGDLDRLRLRTEDEIQFPETIRVNSVDWTPGAVLQALHRQNRLPVYMEDARDNG